MKTLLVNRKFFMFILVALLISFAQVSYGQSITATSVPRPLTEANLHGSVITLTLTGGTYERSEWDIEDAVTVSGIDGVTFDSWDFDRVSDTEVTVELISYGDFDSDATLTFTVGAGAIAGYNGQALTAQVPVPAVEESLIASTASPLRESTLHGSIVTLILSGRRFTASKWDVRDAVAISGIEGVTFNKSWDVDRVSDSKIAVKLTFSGNLDNDATLTFTVGAGAIAGYNGQALTAQVPVPAVEESLTASTASPLKESTLHGSIVTLILSGRRFTASKWDGRDAVAISGIEGVTFNKSWDVDRVSDSKITVKLTFSGNLDNDATLTFTVGAGAIAGYNGQALTAQVPVSAVEESLTASTASPLKESTLHGSIVTLILSGRRFTASKWDVRDAVAVSGIEGVTFNKSWDVDRVSDSKITVKLTFSGNLDSDATLTFTVGAGAIAGYNGQALTAQVPVPAVEESLIASTASPLTEANLVGGIVTLTLSGRRFTASKRDIRDTVTVSGIDGVTFESFDVDRVNNTKITVKLTFSGNLDNDATLTFTVGAGAIAGYNGQALTAQVPVPAVEESLTASTASPLTEANLHGGIVTLTLNGRRFTDSKWDIEDALTVSGIDGVTFDSWDLDRVSDTEVTVELTFTGNLDTDATLTFTVGADAIMRYNEQALTAQVPVSAVQESLVASTASPLTEANLVGGIVTLTLNGRRFTDSRLDIDDEVTVSGIDGVTFESWHVDRVSDTKITVKLAFSGNLDSDATLTFTVRAGAIAGYNGRALTAQIPVPAVEESLIASTASPLTEATLHGSIVTLILSGRRLIDSESDVRDAVAVSGIEGVTVGTFDVDRVNNTKITVKLTFSGNLVTDAALTFTVEADAIAKYNGQALTAQVPVSAVQESLVASSVFPLTQTTLDSSLITLALNSRNYEASSFSVQDALAVSGIDGVTIVSSLVNDSNTEAMVNLRFDGNFNANTTLTFTMGESAIANYKGPALTAEIFVSARTEPLVLVAESQRPSMYWIEEAEILHRLTAVQAEPFLSNQATSFAVDLVNSKIYWIEQEARRSNTLKRADLDGTNPEMVVTLSRTPLSITVDTVGSKLYWINSDNEIQSADLNGESIRTVLQPVKRDAEWCERAGGKVEKVPCNAVENALLTLFTFGVFGEDSITGKGCYTTRCIGAKRPSEPRYVRTDIAVDSINGKLYWTETAWGEKEKGLGRIRCASLDGTNLNTLVTDLKSPISIAAVDGKIYWTEQQNSSQGSIQRANLDGTNVETLTTVLGVPSGLAVDTAEGNVYWSNAAGGIQRVNINGGNIQDVVTGIFEPREFALGPVTPVKSDHTVLSSKRAELLPNYPNPFTPETWIPYRLAEDVEVTLTIYDLSGGVIREFNLGYQTAGVYENPTTAIYWDGTNELGERVVSGVYFYHLLAGDFSAIRKMLILK